MPGPKSPDDRGATSLDCAVHGLTTTPRVLAWDVLVAERMKTTGHDELIVSARSMAHGVALRAARAVHPWLDAEEIRAVADAALVEAWQHFDSGRGVAFTTYAFPWIRGAALRAARAIGAQHTRRARYDEGRSGCLASTPIDLAVEARVALRRIGYRDRGLVFGHVVQGRSFVAMAAGVSAPALRRRYRRALRRARRSLTGLHERRVVVRAGSGKLRP